MTLNILSHNVNGFDRSNEYIRDICCALPPCIYAIQEHWLKPPTKKFPGVNALKSLHPELDGWGTSAMKSSVESRILYGRPFGGTGFVWTKSLSSSIKARNEYQHERVTVMEISSNAGPLLIINAYMPYFDNRNIESQVELYGNVLGFIDSIISDNSHANVILMGDMNCNYYNGSNQFTILLKKFIAQRNLYCTYDSMSSFDIDSTYTRCNLKQNSFSLLDYVFVSRNLIPYINDVVIMDSGDVLSDHIPVRVSFNLIIESIDVSRPYVPSVINWKAVDEVSRKNYETVMDEYLTNITVPRILHGDHVCDETSHINAIEKYYNDILNCIKVAEQQLPRSKPSVQKFYWNRDLSKLKNDSIVTHDFWKMNGKPRSGPIFEAKKHAHYKYKLSLRKSKFEKDQNRVDDLNNDLISGNQNKFWQSFKFFNYSKVNVSSRINGLTNDIEIANCFADNYSRIYQTNDVNQSAVLREKFQSMYAHYSASHINDSIKHLYLSWSDMLNILSKLEPGKATASFVKPEHILYGSPKLAWHIHLLFNAMIQHCYVPCDFLNGTISPLIKDSQGDHSSPDNYRGLTLSVIFSNLFEQALLGKIGHLLVTDSLQFGYKKRHSTSHAIFTLQTTIDYFTSRGSSVFTAFLDCSKGFDKVNHDGIFIKLMERKVPLCILNILVYWYSNLTSIVKWNGFFSYSFAVKSGVRQGGVLSPHLFAIYVNDLITHLRSLHVGCHIFDLFLGCIVYADDICLLAPTRSALQLLLNSCESYGVNWCLSYNPSKSKVMQFGKEKMNPSLFMYNRPLSFTCEYKYLGVNVVAGKNFSTSHVGPLIKFRSSANTVLNVHRKPSENISMKLLYSICVPTMMYACEVTNLNSRQMQSFNVALNDCIRRIFTYNRWESVRFLRISMGYPSVTDICFHRRTAFFKAMPLTRNPTLLAISKLNQE